MATGSLTTALLALLIGTIPPDVVAMKSANFKIPVNIREGGKDKIKEIILYVSADEGKTWNQVGTTKPERDFFIFHAQADGIYWFNLSTINLQGVREPVDIYKVPPSQKVLVDTVKPVLRITSSERQGDEIVVAWEIQEIYPDLSRLKLEYKSADAPDHGWSTAPVTQAMVGQTRFRFVNQGPVQIRMEVPDLAGNVGTAQTEIVARVAQPAPVNSTVVPAAAHSAVIAPAISTTQGGSGVPAPQMNAFATPGASIETGLQVQPNQGSQPVNPWANQTIANQPAGNGQSSSVVQLNNAGAAARTQSPNWEANSAVQTTSLRSSPTQPATTWPMNPPSESITRSVTGGGLAGGSWNGSAPTQSWAANRTNGVQVTNTTQVAVNYEVKNVGASGFSRFSELVSIYDPARQPGLPSQSRASGTRFAQRSADFEPLSCWEYREDHDPDVRRTRGG